MTWGDELSKQVFPIFGVWGSSAAPQKELEGVGDTVLGNAGRAVSVRASGTSARAAGSREGGFKQLMDLSFAGGSLSFLHRCSHQPEAPSLANPGTHLTEWHLDLAPPSSPRGSENSISPARVTRGPRAADFNLSCLASADSFSKPIWI